jgi:hypothetical protein
MKHHSEHFDRGWEWAISVTPGLSEEQLQSLLNRCEHESVMEAEQPSGSSDVADYLAGRVAGVDMMLGMLRFDTPV